MKKLFNLRNIDLPRKTQFRAYAAVQIDNETTFDGIVDANSNSMKNCYLTSKIEKYHIEYL